MDDLLNPDSFETTMTEQGKLRLNLEYPEYGDAIEQYGDKSAEIAATAERFKDNSEDLDILFSNLDSLDLIRDAEAAGADGSAVLQNITDLKELRADPDFSAEVEEQFFNDQESIRATCILYTS